MAGTKRGGFGTFKKSYAKKRSSPDGEDDAPQAHKKSKKDDEEADAKAIEPKLGKDDDGNSYISLNASGKRRVTVSDYNKNTLVSIREYWVNDGGELKPGKKGISLTIEQYNTLLAAVPLIESVLAKKEIQVVRPDYNADIEDKEEASKESEQEEEEAEEEDDDED